MTSASRFFIVGIAGVTLTSGEIELFRDFPPGGIILFARNIESERQLKILVPEIRSLLPEVMIFVDQEGGPVDRFRALTGGSISLAGAAALHEAEEAGRLAGELCAYFGIDVDLSPVVDRAVPGAGANVLRGRCAADDPEDVVCAAGGFLSGLREIGVGSCLKHFPGLGRGKVDSHQLLPLIPADSREREKDLLPFRRLGAISGAIMISHAAGEDRPVPATLDPAVATGLLRGELQFSGLALSDDLEMDALSLLDIPARARGAFAAGCDLLCLGKKTSLLPACCEQMEREIAPERFVQAERRRESFRSSLLLLKEIKRAARPLREIVKDTVRLKARGDA